MENSTKKTITLLGKEVRTLYESEIECRVGQVSQKTQSVSILLYKNARCDMNLLDEIVGAENWQRDHKEIKGNLYCGVGINTDTGFIWKWDCGVESNTEKEKGEASDSFKRACVNWGIGRELYSAPQIWIKLSDDEWNGGKPYVRFNVALIAYDDNREICDLVIDDKDGVTRFEMRGKRTKRTSQSTKPATTAEKPITAQNGAKTTVTMQLFTSGKCANLIKHLAGIDPEDYKAWEAGVGQLQAKYDFGFGVMEEIEKAAKQFRAQSMKA